MTVPSPKKSFTQQLAIRLLLAGFATFALWFSYATLNDLWVWVILCAKR